MKGVYINIYYTGRGKHDQPCIRVHYVHTGADKRFCDPRRNPHSKAMHERMRRRQRRHQE